MLLLYGEGAKNDVRGFGASDTSSNAAGKEARFKMDVRNAGCRRLDAFAWCCFLTGRRKETAGCLRRRKSGEEGMDEVFVLSDLVGCYVHGPRIRGIEVRAGLSVEGLEVQVGTLAFSNAFLA